LGVPLVSLGEGGRWRYRVEAFPADLDAAVRAL
jgi:hypothetical protein